MRPVLAIFVGLLARVGRSRQDLLLENVALRHHLMLCERRPRVTEKVWREAVRVGVHAQAPAQPREEGARWVSCSAWILRSSGPIPSPAAQKTRCRGSATVLRG